MVSFFYPFVNSLYQIAAIGVQYKRNIIFQAIDCLHTINENFDSQKLPRDDS